MANYPVLKCRYCGKESSRPGWITNNHEPECPSNPNRGHAAPATTDPLRVGMQAAPQAYLPPANSAVAPAGETPEQELERLRRRCQEYESNQRSLIRDQERINAELERTRRELQGRKGCVLCNKDLLPESVRKVISQEVVKTVSQKPDVMRELLSSVILPSMKAEDE